MSRPPPSKRARMFLVENLLADTNAFASFQNQHGSGAEKKPEDYIKKLESTIMHNLKFNLVKCLSKFIIKDVPADPEGLLMGLFQFCVDESMLESRNKGMEPDQLGCTISSELLDTDIWIPIRAITDNTVESILNRFLIVAQSKKQQGITLWGSPFTVNITTVKRDGLPARQIRGSARRQLAPVHHRISPGCLIKINNFNDTYCLFYALQATLINKAFGKTKSQFYEYLHGRYGSRGIFQRDVSELMKNVEAPVDLEEYDAETWVPKVVDYWNDKLYGDKFKVKVFIFGTTGHYKPIFKYGPESFDVALLLYFNNGHFDGVNRTGGLFGNPYCLSCEKPFDNEQRHTSKCKSHCLKCGCVGPAFPCKPMVNYSNRCGECSKMFNNPDCFQRHLQRKMCKFSKQCSKCGEIWLVRQNTRDGREGHVCKERYCGKCGDWHDPKRGCFIKPLEPKKDQPCRYVVFDLETMQDTSLPDDPSKKQHIPNFISAMVACPECIANGRWKESLKNGAPCKVCGQDRTITFSMKPFDATMVDRYDGGPEPLKLFVQWILYQLPKDYETFAYSHFGGKFDMVLTFKELFMEGLNPQMLKRGNKMYEMRVEKRISGLKVINPRIIFRDSFNLMPMSLAALVPSFGLDVEDKPFFPHLANKDANYGKQIFPCKEDYLADGMMPAKRKQFDNWYEQNKHNPFQLEEALASYCTNDVDILMSALIAFRSEFLEVSKRPANSTRAASDKPHDGIDVLRESMTIASACMRHFRTNHLRKEHIAIVPERGYDNADNQSLLALKFLHWYTIKHDISVQTANTLGGEKKVANYKLDGWVEEKQLGIEINGCAWHACLKCYPEDNMKLPNGKTAGKVRELNKRRLDFIKTQIPEVQVFWECDINRMKESDQEMRQIFDSYLDDGPIDIRSSFYGGRTGPLKLFHAATPDETISYIDVSSLYPFICCSTRYPIGIPERLILNKDVNWTHPDHNPYKTALLKVFVVPPRKIDVPVLPIKFDERLLFPTCAVCSRKYPTGAVLHDYTCRHTDQQRGWVSTCTSIELNVALEEGYKVTKVFRVLEYKETDDSLFKSYMSEFMAQKIHASGFDEKIRGNLEQEEQFIHECAEYYGIIVDRAKMLPNKGKRALAKLAVNNLWGRFSLRNFGLSQCHITDDPAELGEYLDDKSIEVTAIDELTPEVILISYIKKKEWVEEHASSNVIISLWTTSAARIHLLRSMQKVARTPGCKLLYTDTDSIIYAHPASSTPIQLGPHLGQFTDEYPHHHIIEFCSGGAKQYGLKLQRKDDANSGYEYVLKVRGMTLNYDVINNQGLRYETFKQKVIKYATTGEIDPIQIIYPHFLRPSIPKSRITTQTLQKIYKPFVGKGIVSPNDFRVLDFGFIQ